MPRPGLGQHKRPEKPWCSRTSPLRCFLKIKRRAAEYVAQTVRDFLHPAGPGRAESARRLVALADEIGSGTTVFVSGDERDGREALLRAVAAELEGGEAIVVA